MQTIEQQLAAQDMRLATNNEAGWYALVIDPETDKVVKVWATTDEGDNLSPYTWPEN